jgi:predicted DNA binding protein
MAFWRISLELPSGPLIETGLAPAGFFRHNESIEILRVYSFQPKERLLLARIARSGPPRTKAEIARQRETLRRRYQLRDFDIVDVGADGRTYVALLRQENPGILEDLLEELGAGVTPIPPTLLRKDRAILSFVADDRAKRRVFTLLEGLGIRWKLRASEAIRTPASPSDVVLTARQQELLSLAWNLGYFDVPARTDLARLAALTGLSRNVISQHLRRGMRRILREWIA